MSDWVAPETVRLMYLSELLRTKTAISREVNAVQAGGETLQSLSDALCALRQIRVAYRTVWPTPHHEDEE